MARYTTAESAAELAERLNQAAEWEAIWSSPQHVVQLREMVRDAARAIRDLQHDRDDARADLAWLEAESAHERRGLYRPKEST